MYTDEQITEALENAKRTCRENVVLEWAATEYLKAKKVLEFYADESTYDPNEVLDRKCMGGYRPDIYLVPQIKNDKGQRARDFLNGKEK